MSAGRDRHENLTTEHCTPQFAQIQYIDVKSIASIAVSVRGKASDSKVSCTVGRNLGLGAYSTSWTIIFEDGLEWVFHTPLIEYSPILGERIKSDVSGIQLIQSKTNVPIPRLVDFSASPENPLGRPYVVMEKARGVPLSDLWPDLSDEKRKTIFKSLASTMSQLKGIEFDQIGSLYFDDTSNNYIVGPTIPSYEEILDGYVTTRGTYPTTHTYLLGEIRRQLSINTDNDRKLFLALMRVFAGFIPDHHFDEQPFVISSPSLDLHSVFVDEDGIVTGITLWDSLFIGPREGGYAKYPSWITSDWDPIIDRYPSEKVAVGDLSDDEEYSTQGGSSADSRPDSPAKVARDEQVSLTSFTGASAESTPDPVKVVKESLGDQEPPRESDGSAKSTSDSPLRVTIDDKDPQTKNVGTSLDDPSVTEDESSDDQDPSTSYTENTDPIPDSPEKKMLARLQAFRDEYLEAFTEVDPTSAQYTRFSHVFNALERTILSAKPGVHILDKFKQFMFGPSTKEDNGDLLEIPVLLKRLSMGKWIHDL